MQGWRDFGCKLFNKWGKIFFSKFVNAILRIIGRGWRSFSAETIYASAHG